MGTRRGPNYFNGFIQFNVPDLSGTTSEDIPCVYSYTVNKTYKVHYNIRYNLYVLSQNAKYSQDQLRDYFQRGYVVVINKTTDLTNK